MKGLWVEDEGEVVVEAAAVVVVTEAGAWAVRRLLVGNVVLRAELMLAAGCAEAAMGEGDDVPLLVVADGKVLLWWE